MTPQERARERRRRLHVRDAHNPKLPRILKMIADGMLHREIGEALHLDRSRISQIVRAAKVTEDGKHMIRIWRVG